MKRVIRLKAYAKINLFLDVKGKRDDGYHDIVSIMQSIDLYDIVTVKKKSSGGIKIICNNPSVPDDHNNIAYKCADLFFKTQGIASGSVEITIDKRIPVAGGLAGGSTDGASVLKALNILYDQNLDITELCTIGSKIGADIPYCLKGGTCLCEGIGDILTPFESDLKSYIFVLAEIPASVSTKEAYEIIDKNNIKENSLCVDKIINSLKEGNLRANLLYNVFEKIEEQNIPQITSVKNVLDSFDALKSMMSGSGPTVFGIFSNLKNAASACSDLKDKGINAYICRSI